MKKCGLCVGIFATVALLTNFSVNFGTSTASLFAADTINFPMAGMKDQQFSLSDHPQEDSAEKYPIHSGYPYLLDYWIETAPITIADIDGNGINEFLLPTWNTGAQRPAKIYAWDISGNLLPGFPIATEGRVQGRLALGDLDEDGKLEIVAGVESFSEGAEALIFVWRSDGTLYSGWPQNTACNKLDNFCSVRSIVVADVDGDSIEEIVAATNNGTGGAPDPSKSYPALYVWHRDGRLASGSWPVADDLDVNIVGAVAVGDLDGNGRSDILTGRDYNRLFAYDNQGQHLSGWPVKVWWPYDRNNLADDQIEFTRSAVTLADLDGDGSLEYIVNGLRRKAESIEYYNTDLLVYSANGQRWRGWETPASGFGLLSQMTWRMLEAPAIGDINRDRQPDIVVTTQDGWVRAYTAGKQLLWQVNYTQGNFLYATEAVIGDVDGDGWNEVLFGTFDPNYGNVGPVGVWIIRYDGMMDAGAPLWVDTPGINGAPSLGDLDGDGKLEIAATTVLGKIYVWDAPGDSSQDRLPWPMARHNLQRTGLYPELTPDFSESKKTSNVISARSGDTVTFTIRLVLTGGDLQETLLLTDTIPAGMRYIPGSLRATLGQVDDRQAPRLQWSGMMSEQRQVEISYDVSVTQAFRGSVTNSAVLDAGPAGQLTLSASLVINGENLYLPIMRK